MTLAWQHGTYTICTHLKKPFACRPFLRGTFLNRMLECHERSLEILGWFGQNGVRADTPHQSGRNLADKNSQAFEDWPVGRINICAFLETFASCVSGAIPAQCCPAAILHGIVGMHGPCMSTRRNLPMFISHHMSAYCLAVQQAKGALWDQGV